MNTKQFKNIIYNSLRELGFENKDRTFFWKNEEVIVTVKLQKSQHSNSYYINFGILIKVIHPNTEFPKYQNCDIRGRFKTYEIHEAKGDLWDLKELEDLSELTIQSSIEMNVNNITEPIEQHGLAYFLEQNPVLLYQTTLEAKESLKVNT